MENQQTSNTMKMLSVDASDLEIIQYVECWIAMLAMEDYESAYDFVKHDPYYCWSPKLIEEVINGYGLPEPHPSGKVFKVTPIDTATGSPPANDVERDVYEDNRIGYVLYDIPLNGEWSDLSATFRLENSNSQLDVILEEIHVF